MGTDLNNLGLLYLLSNRYAEADKVYQRALSIRIHALGENDPAVAETMGSYAQVLSGLRRNVDAKEMRDKAHAILSNSSAK